MKRLCVLALLFVLLAFPSNVRADIAPPIYPPGSNPQPGTEFTQVRMAAETVIIEVQKDITPESLESLGRAHVTADFTMRNLGTADERMAVRFPIAGNDGRGGYPEISDLQIKVNGKQTLYRRTNYKDDNYPNGDIPWAEFDVTFPARQDVPIRVSYELQGSGYYPFTAFYYVLETGAGWKATIGSADVILRLPYEASLQNVVMNLQIGWAETTPDGVFRGNEVRWHFENFEPGQDQSVQNMEFALVAPSMWQTVLIARANVKQHPNDGEAWGQLGRAYKQVSFPLKGNREDKGGKQLYQLSVEAYEKCLSLKPDDAQWHAGFADLLAEHAMWDSGPELTPEGFRALQEIHTALELAPNDPLVREVAQNMVYMIDGGITQNGEEFDFPGLTQTATITARPAQPTVTPVDASTATPSPLPAVTDTPQLKITPVSPTRPNPTPVPQASNPICGSAMLLPVVAITWFVWKRR